MNKQITPVGTEMEVRALPTDSQLHSDPRWPSTPWPTSLPSPLRTSQLTQNEKSQTIEDGTHEGQDVEEKGQLGVRVRVSRAYKALPRL